MRVILQWLRRHRLHTWERYETCFRSPLNVAIRGEIHVTQTPKGEPPVMPSVDVHVTGVHWGYIIEVRRRCLAAGCDADRYVETRREWDPAPVRTTEGRS